MAQFWHPIETAADLDSFTKFLGNGVADFFDDAGTPTMRITPGSDNRTFFRFDDAGTAIDDMQVAVYGRQGARTGGLHLCTYGRGNASTQASNEYYLANTYGLAGGRGVQLQVSPLGSAGFTQLDFDTTGLSSDETEDNTQYYWQVLDVSGSTISASWLVGDPTDLVNLPAWQFQVTNTAVTTAGSCGVLGYRSNDSSVMYVHIIAIGTDGDPAPTGPVDVSAEGFLLRHNPRTNKVIPVLTSPTVTDIGATCVRPRVTKGF